MPVVETFYISLHRSAECENAPFQNYLTKEWKVSQLNEHTAQSPPVDGRTLWLLQPAEDSRLISFIVLTFKNIYLKLTSARFSITPRVAYFEVI